VYRTVFKLLETANIKVSSVLGKVTGLTFRSILEGLATARTLPVESLALLARHKRVRDKQEQLRKALGGCLLTEHFRFQLGELLAELAEPSQFDIAEAGMSFVFNKGTPKVSTTF